VFTGVQNPRGQNPQDGRRVEAAEGQEGRSHEGRSRSSAGGQNLQEGRIYKGRSRRRAGGQKLQGNRIRRRAEVQEGRSCRREEFAGGQNPKEDKRAYPKKPQNPQNLLKCKMYRRAGGQNHIEAIG
jgi:hypothetical protein